MYMHKYVNVTDTILQEFHMSCFLHLLKLSLIFSIYRSTAVSNGMYILLGLGLVGFLAVEVIMVSFAPSVYHCANS